MSEELKPWQECHYCKLKHKDVEAGGVYYCENPLCTGPGASWMRRSLASYKINDDGTHTVDAIELVSKGMVVAAAAGPEVVEAAAGCVERHLRK
jgi:hypothetical protein